MCATQDSPLNVGRPALAGSHQQRWCRRGTGRAPCAGAALAGFGSPPLTAGKGWREGLTSLPCKTPPVALATAAPQDAAGGPADPPLTDPTWRRGPAPAPPRGARAGGGRARGAVKGRAVPRPAEGLRPPRGR